MCCNWLWGPESWTFSFFFSLFILGILQVHNHSVVALWLQKCNKSSTKNARSFLSPNLPARKLQLSSSLTWKYLCLSEPSDHSKMGHGQCEVDKNWFNMSSLFYMQESKSGGGGKAESQDHRLRTLLNQDRNPNLLALNIMLIFPHCVNWVIVHHSSAYWPMLIVIWRSMNSFWYSYSYFYISN